MVSIIIKTLTQATMWAEEGRRKLAACVAVAALATTLPAFAVDFSLNFQANAPIWSETNTTGSCPLAAATCVGHDFGNGDPTPFQLTVEQVGTSYYFHTIVGDPALGFAVESYTPYNGGPNLLTQGTIPDGGGAFSPAGGGNETAFMATPPTSYNTPAIGTSTSAFMTSSTNMVYPLGVSGDPTLTQHISGSGTTDPTKTVFRMVMTDAKGDMSMEVVKPFLDKKPMISQTVQSPDGVMSSSFVVDMTAISYNDMNTPATIVNNTKIQDPTAGSTLGSAADFSMALAQHPDVTAGRFIYTPGAGWNSASGWDSANSSFTPGQYTYFDTGGFNPLTFDWASQFHYDENRLACSRPGSNSTAGVNNGVRGLQNGGTSCPGAP